MSGEHPFPELDAKGLREFGLTTGGIVAVLFGLLLPWLFGRQFPVWPWPVAGVLAAWALIAPATLRPVYRTWMRFGLLISKVTVPVIMFVVFVFMITPVGLLRRALGRGSIAKGFSLEAETYRVESKKIEPKDLERPF